MAASYGNTKQRATGMAGATQETSSEMKQSGSNSNTIPQDEETHTHPHTLHTHTPSYTIAHHHTLHTSTQPTYIGIQSVLDENAGQLTSARQSVLISHLLGQLANTDAKVLREQALQEFETLGTSLWI
jgi:hypothetical protein